MIALFMAGDERFKRGVYVLSSGCENAGDFRVRGDRPIVKRTCRNGGVVTAEATLVSNNQVEMKIKCEGGCNGGAEKILASDVADLF